jgi:hypothetical protein
MAHKVVKEVTQPVHGPDGFSVLYSPGDQFEQDHELPPEVPWRLAIAEIPEEKPAAKPEAAKPAAKHPSGKGT